MFCQHETFHRRIYQLVDSSISLITVLGAYTSSKQLDCRHMCTHKCPRSFIHTPANTRSCHKTWHPSGALLKAPCHHWSIRSWVVQVVIGTWEPGLVHTGAPDTFMLILARYQKNDWRLTSHHIMWEHSHNLIVIQSQKVLQDFTANGCPVAGVKLCCGHAELLWKWAVVFLRWWSAVKA